ncbi:MAG: sugar-binding domain-containing protein [Tissierellia bacterium]|nr:sugar-binding domain-containing protein [Tissierellia bacterium]
MNLLDVSKLTPELVQVFLDRYEILRVISNNQPIGRRGIAKLLSLNERYVRNQTEVLSDLHYIATKETGMTITFEGQQILQLSSKYAQAFRNVEILEDRIQSALAVSRIHVVDADIGGYFNSGLFASTAGDLVLESIHDNSIVGITGGSTMKLIVDGMPSDTEKKNVIVVPARGSLGKKYEYQSNAIVEIFAEKIHADYFTINFPDQMDAEWIQTSELSEDIQKYNDLIENIDVLVFGIGRADTMAGRRGLRPSTLSILEKNGAVAEAFGNYFDLEGNILYESKSIGLGLEGYNRVDRVIAVAYGIEKVEPIIALSKVRKDITIIIDLDCAEQLASKLRLFSSNYFKGGV